MAHVSNEGDPNKLRPLTVPKIIEQLERALIDVKYNHTDDDELAFNKIDNVQIDSKNGSQSKFIGKELMLFEMIGILNGKISELQKKYDKIKTLEEREKEFISEKAEQITKPIQDIVDYAKLAKAGQIDPTEAWESVLDVTKKLENITTVVLDTNRITNDSLELSLKNQNINEIISEIVGSVKSSTEVPFLIGLDHEIEIPLDKVRFSQVIQSILNNSVKYTESGHIKVESFVAYKQNLVIIRIEDTGIGIPKHILPKLFQQGVTKNRVEDGNKAKLSLYLCKGIIDAHRGEISAKNNNGRGCTFTISLPIKKKLEK